MLSSLATIVTPIFPISTPPRLPAAAQSLVLFSLSLCHINLKMFVSVLIVPLEECKNFPVCAVKVYIGSRCITPIILKLGTR